MKVYQFLEEQVVDLHIQERQSNKRADGILKGHIPKGESIQKYSDEDILR